jgi:hypothetical protein
VGVCLFGKHEALSSNPRTTKKRRKKNAIMSFAGKWMELELKIIKAKYCMLSLSCGT